MSLHKLTNRIFYMDHEPEFDRPMLVYIQGEKFSLAIDAGYSKSHVNKFYGLLEEEGLNCPRLYGDYALALRSYLWNVLHKRLLYCA